MYTIKLVKSTGCLLLVDSNDPTGYVDYKFINSFQLENFMTTDDIMEEVKVFADKNKITEYEVDLSEVTNNTVKCTYADGNTITTRINGTMRDVRNYFLGQYINIGHIEDNVQQCIKVEEVK